MTVGIDFWDLIHKASQWPWHTYIEHVDWELLLLVVGAIISVMLMLQWCSARVERDSKTSSQPPQTPPKYPPLDAKCCEVLRAFVETYMKANDPSHDILHVDRVVALAMDITRDEAVKYPDINWPLVQLGAYLHDLFDWKYTSIPVLATPPAHKSEVQSGTEITPSVSSADHKTIPAGQQEHDWTTRPSKRQMLEGELVVKLTPFQVTLQQIQLALDLVSTIGYKDSLPFEAKRDTDSKSSVQIAVQMWSIERAIIQDTDRLDAMGAIGVARMFCFGGAVSSKHPKPLVDLSLVPRVLDTREKYERQHDTPSTIFNHVFEKLIHLDCQTKLGQQLAVQRRNRLLRFAQFLLQDLKECHDPHYLAFARSPVVSHAFLDLDEDLEPIDSQDE